MRTNSEKNQDVVGEDRRGALSKSQFKDKTTLDWMEEYADPDLVSKVVDKELLNPVGLAYARFRNYEQMCLQLGHIVNQKQNGWGYSKVVYRAIRKFGVTYQHRVLADVVETQAFPIKVENMPPLDVAEELSIFTILKKFGLTLQCDVVFVATVGQDYEAKSPSKKLLRRMFWTMIHPLQGEIALFNTLAWQWNQTHTGEKLKMIETHMSLEPIRWKQINKRMQTICKTYSNEVELADEVHNSLKRS